MMVLVPLTLMLLLQSSRALFVPSTVSSTISWACVRSRTSAVAAGASSLSTDDAPRDRTALLWMSPNRLRLRDNVALAKAAELGPDGLAVCLVWPYASTSSSITPVEAFGLAAARSLNESLGELGQRLVFLPSQGNGEQCSCDPPSIIADAVERLNPAHVVVDAALLDRHRNPASRLRDKLVSKNDGNTTDTPSIVEVVDDGLLIPFDKVNKALGRSRRGGRALRWTTFLGNIMKRIETNDDELQMATSMISELPPPLPETEEMISSMPLPEEDSFPPWARQLLSDWGEASEDEAMRRASGSACKGESVSSPNASPLTEEGSRNTKLSPYLRWGVLSPQRAAKSGVRIRDLLWRDWSHVCYGLLGPLRRGEPVLDYMDNWRCAINDELDVEEEDLFLTWCVGNTGSLLVDAGMRQLWKEGWMPRRMRILAAACLVEGLGIDWRRGRDWFAHTLIDHDCINECMWQNAGLCGVDPFYTGVMWEAAPKEVEEQEYVNKWCNEKLVWPSHLRQFSEREPLVQLVEKAKSKRNALREKGAYKAARTVVNSGVRVSWPGLSESRNSTKAAVADGEVIGVGLVPIDELRFSSSGIQEQETRQLH